MAPEDGGWVRLHALSPLLTAGRAGGLVLLLVFRTLAEEADTIDVGLRLLLVVAGILVVAILVGLAYSMVAWRFREYRLTADTVELRTGILLRSKRHLPYERVETVDTRRSLVPRIFGLAEVRVEAISSKGNELRLRYLADAPAERLREELLARKHGAAPEELAAPAPPPTPLVQVPAGELAKGYLLFPGASALAGLLVVAALTATVDLGAAVGVAGVGAITVAAVFVPLVLRLENLWGFRIESGADALVVHQGMVNLSTRRIRPGRVQALRVDQPLTWRLLGRYRLAVDVAGYRGAEGEDARLVDVLLPIGPAEVVRRLILDLEVGHDLDALPHTTVPARARWRAPLRWRALRLARTPTHTVVRWGRLWRHTAIVPTDRLQSVRVVQGPWQRRLDLATVHFDTAGTRIKVAARHRDAAEAAVLAAELAAAAARPVGSAVENGTEPVDRAETLGTAL